jgi:hypothetical protein
MTDTIINILNKECTDLKKKIGRQEIIITKLKSGLHIEKFKSNFFSKLLETKFGFNVDDMIKITNDGIHIYDYPDNPEVFVHQNNINDQTITLDVFREVNTDNKEPPILHIGKLKQTTFKSISKIDEEDPQEQEKKVQQTEQNFDIILKEHNMDASYTDTIKEIDLLFAEISKVRIFRQQLSKISEKRLKLIATLPLKEYIVLINSHLDKLKTILVNKNTDLKKIHESQALFLLPLEKRLLFFPKYYNTELSIEEYQKFGIALKVNMKYPSRYIPFNYAETYHNLYNYGLAIFPIKENIIRTLVNPSSFHTIIYLKKESDTSDLFRFYLLDKIDDTGRRCWRMDCRLVDFAHILGENLLNYCILLFRRIYFDVFNDNVYREDYKNGAVILRIDVEQLFSNIILLSKQDEFRDLLREIIVTNCTIKPSKLDKFNLTADDRMSKKMIEQEVKGNGVLETLCKLFDNLDVETAKKIGNSVG